ncbi:MAG: ACT domain-containing protein, partial [Rhizobium oryzihabitans]
MTTYVMKVSCPARSGIVAAVSGYLARSGCNINDSSQFTDQETGRVLIGVWVGWGAGGV